MKKHFLIPILLLAFLVLGITACQKDSQPSETLSALSSDVPVADRTTNPYNPCGNRQTVWAFSNLCANGKMPLNAFKLGWKLGELDRIANDCVLGNTLPGGNCNASGTMSFPDLPQFRLSNFADANGYVTPQQQDRIISLALAYASSQITSCGEGYSPIIYQIDFVITLQSPTTIEFAVRYSCCESNDTDG